MSKLDLIRENLFLGDFCGAAKILNNGSTDISHVLTILHCPSISTFEEWGHGKIDSKEIKEVYVGDEQGKEYEKESSLVSGNLLYSLEHTGKDLEITRMAILAHDEHWENLLDYFDLCLDFIDVGRKEKGVLVHCYAGQSRSASIVIAYLMRTEKLSLEDALVSIRQSSHVSPNPGFLTQLDLFEKMHFKVDRSSPIYKRFRLKALGYLYSKDKKLDKLKLRSDPDISNLANGTTTYQCKICRRVLLSQGQVMNHTPGEADIEFDAMFANINGDLHNKNHGGDEQQCTSIFVEPLSWMNQVEEGLCKGTLLCPTPTCKTKLGSFSWSGSYCSCGSKIVPAFQLQISRVDVINVKDDTKKKKKHNNKKK